MSVGDEFAESKSVGLALFCWVQLLVVAGPMLFLIDSDNPSARYFLQAGVIFAVCVSMLCFIFGPIIWQKQRSAAEQRTQDGYGTRYPTSVSRHDQIPKISLRERGRVHISGIATTGKGDAGARKYPRVRDLAKEFHDVYSSDEDSSFGGDSENGHVQEMPRQGSSNAPKNIHRDHLERVDEFEEKQ